MALALPYPDMDFVPLDILTAAEQDQLVANIEYIANQFPLAGSNIGTGAIGTSQLSSNAVTPAKMDFSSFNNVLYGGNTGITLPTGQWLIICSVYLVQTSQSALAEIDYELRIDGTRLTNTNRIWQVGSNTAARMFDTVTLIANYTATASSALTFATTKLTNGTVTRYDLAAIPMFS